MTGTDMTDILKRVAEQRERDEAERAEAVENPSMWEPSYGFCASNESDRVVLAMTLEAIRRQVCCYGGGNRCDCKYGLMPDIYAVVNEFGITRGEKSPQRNALAGRDFYNGTKGNSEQTGCPELRELIHRLLHRDQPLI